MNIVLLIIGGIAALYFLKPKNVLSGSAATIAKPSGGIMADVKTVGAAAAQVTGTIKQAKQLYDVGKTVYQVGDKLVSSLAAVPSQAESLAVVSGLDLTSGLSGIEGLQAAGLSAEALGEIGIQAAVVSSQAESIAVISGLELTSGASGVQGLAGAAIGAEALGEGAALSGAAAASEVAGATLGTVALAGGYAAAVVAAGYAASSLINQWFPENNDHTNPFDSMPQYDPKAERIPNVFSYAPGYGDYSSPVSHTLWKEFSSESGTFERNYEWFENMKLFLGDYKNTVFNPLWLAAKYKEQTGLEPPHGRLEGPFGAAIENWFLKLPETIEALAVLNERLKHPELWNPNLKAAVSAAPTAAVWNPYGILYGYTEGGGGA